MEEAEKKQRGRPPKGKEFPHKVFSYLDDATLRLLEQMEEHRNGSGRKRGRAGTIRAALKALAEKEKVK